MGISHQETAAQRYVRVPIYNSRVTRVTIDPHTCSCDWSLSQHLRITGPAESANIKGCEFNAEQAVYELKFILFTVA